MRIRKPLLTVLPLVGLSSMLASRAGAAEGVVTVEAITDLGTLGGTFSIAFDINDAGQVVGVR